MVRLGKMVKHPFNCKIITCGASEVGKTAFLEKLINNTVLTDQLSAKVASSGSGSSQNNNQQSTSQNAPGQTATAAKESFSSPRNSTSSSTHSQSQALAANSTSAHSNNNSNLQTSSSNNLHLSHNSLNVNGDNLFPSSTKEDIYLCTVNSERGPAVVRIHDTPGVKWSSKATLPRHYCQLGDGFLLFFDLTNLESFKNIEYIKTEILRERERRDVHLVVVGMKKDLESSRAVESSLIEEYIERENLHYFECTINDRSSLSKPIQHIIMRMVAPVPKTGLLSRRMPAR